LYANDQIKIQISDLDQIKNEEKPAEISELDPEQPFLRYLITPVLKNAMASSDPVYPSKQ